MTALISDKPQFRKKVALKQDFCFTRLQSRIDKENETQVRLG